MEPNQTHWTKIEIYMIKAITQIWTKLHCGLPQPFPHTSTSFRYNPCCSFVGVGLFLYCPIGCELQVSIRFVIIDASCHIWVCENDPACAL